MDTPPPKSTLRIVEADRRQMELVPHDLESVIPEDHQARTVWEFVTQMDVAHFYASVKAREGRAGRPPTDPKVLLALWLYGGIDGVGSAREIVRLTESDDAYRWIRGGVPLNHHMVSDFRVEHGEALDDLLTQSIAAMLQAGAVTLSRVAQDGTRVRASAGSGSFRREPSLEACLVKAQEQLEWVRREAEEESPRKNARQLAAKKRAAEKRLERIDRALKALPKIKQRQENKRRAARASTTDPDARIMKMGDGGYRPAYNMQFATDADSQAIVGVDVTDSPADAHEMGPMLDQIKERTGRLPDAHLVDGGYVHFESIEAADAAGVSVYAPLKETGRPRKDGMKTDPLVPTARDSEAITHLRLRMASDEGRETYRLRGQTAELSNAEVKGRQKLVQVAVRGIDKVKCVALFAALAVNLVRMASFGMLQGS